MDFLDLCKEKAFIGREFLTWLWFKSEQTGGSMELRSGKYVEVIFLDRMTLDMTEADAPQSVTIKGEHSQLREGLAALREGKKIEEARVSLKDGENEFTVLLKSTWFQFGQFRTPPILPSGESDEHEGPEGKFLEKTYLLESGLNVIDGLFEQFLKIRISETWDKVELPAIRSWIAHMES